MAQENVKLFKEALQKDSVLQAKLKEKEAAYAGDKEDRVKIVEEILIPLATESGFPFIMEELKAEEEVQQKEGALSEEELQNVSGGKINWIVSTFGLCFLAGAGIGAGCTGAGAALCALLGFSD